jgi:hypothetical protein
MAFYIACVAGIPWDTLGVALVALVIRKMVQNSKAKGPKLKI